MDRQALGRYVLGDKEALGRLEAAVHPLVKASRDVFLAQHTSLGTRLVVLDIPLLYEKGLQGEVDSVAVVSCGAEVQRRRVLARGWSEEKYKSVLALQVRCRCMHACTHPHMGPCTLRPLVLTAACVDAD